MPSSGLTSRREPDTIAAVTICVLLSRRAWLLAAASALATYVTWVSGVC